MTNKLGVTFVKGMWYNCQYVDYFFQYLEDRREGGVRTIKESHSSGSPAKHRHDYISNPNYLDNATLATTEELIKLGVTTEPLINDSYSIY